MFYAFVLGQLHAVLSAFDVEQSKCADCEEGQYGYNLSTSTKRKTCRNCFSRDIAILNCETKAILDHIATPTGWSESYLKTLTSSSNTYVSASLSARYRAKGYEFDGLFPVEGTPTFKKSLSDLKAAHKAGSTDWMNIPLGEYLLDGKELDTKSVLERYVREISKDRLIDRRVIAASLIQGKVPKDLNVDGNPYEKIREQVETRIELGRYKGNKTTAKAIHRVLTSTVLPDNLEKGTNYHEANLVNSMIQDSGYYFTDVVSINSYKISDRYTKSVPHYGQMWFTRYFCCNETNEFAGDVERIPCQVHALRAEIEDGPPVTRIDVATLDFGTSEESSGTLRLAGTPPLSERDFSRAAAAVREGIATTILKYLVQKASVVQRKLGGIPAAVMATLTAVWGGIEAIPPGAVEAVRGKDQQTGLDLALKKTVIGQKQTSASQPPANAVKQATAKPAPKPNAKALKQKKDVPFKDKDPKVVQKVCSCYGASGFRAILAVIRAELGDGKFPIVKMADCFHAGKLKPGKKAEALSMKLN